MKIPNYDPDVAATNGFRQGHPTTPADVFRMLICGPSNSGKTNILLHMLYELLEFDKVFLFSKNLHQHKYQALLRDFAENIDPEVGYEVIEAPGDEIIPLEELPPDNQKIVVFDDLVCEKNQNDIINYFINGRHRNCSVIYLIQTYYKVPKTSGTTAAISAFSVSSRRKTNESPTSWACPLTCWTAPPTKSFPSFTSTNRKKLMKKISTKQYNGVVCQTTRNFQKTRSDGGIDSSFSENRREHPNDTPS